MPYKDPTMQRAAVREATKRYRARVSENLVALWTPEEPEKPSPSLVEKVKAAVKRSPSPDPGTENVAEYWRRVHQALAEDDQRMMARWDRGEFDMEITRFL